ncbi:DNA-binding transcriptional regulator, XRE-family HTH domain [Goodfellowiella coeruleoviolacea]|uniref:DNA-binding transcriptional regulator, XRE-family HTH domain n=2 Tax=Goodfellowiella coeruleoviolacea TaxID=334858 RepID=A0AAE3GI77_9PSEU|nr:DNA-binding transcriptional regulator, XRE-family HTH domain [Goodfellowiella coeruleoviolacea]
MVRISQLRRAHGMTLADLVRRIAEQGVTVTQSGISNVENGRKRASDRLLIAWAKALGLNPLDVWHGPVSTPQPEVDEPEHAA